MPPIFGCILPPKKRLSELSRLAATLRHMGDFVLQGAILVRGLGNERRSDFRSQLCAPGQLPTASRVTSVRSNLCPWKRFHALLEEAFEHRGRRWIAVCSKRSSNQGLCVSHVGSVVV